MLGGSNSVGGSNPSGTGTGLNYLRTNAGTFVSAYNTQSMIDAVTSVLNFETGSEVIVGQFTFTGPIRFDAGNISSGEIGGCQILMNGETIALLKCDTAQEDMPTVVTFDVVFSPYTRIECNIVNAAEIATFNQTLSFTGRSYA